MVSYPTLLATMKNANAVTTILKQFCFILLTTSHVVNLHNILPSTSTAGQTVDKTKTAGITPIKFIVQNVTASEKLTNRGFDFRNHGLEPKFYGNDDEGGDTDLRDGSLAYSPNGSGAKSLVTKVVLHKNPHTRRTWEDSGDDKYGRWVVPDNLEAEAPAASDKYGVAYLGSTCSDWSDCKIPHSVCTRGRCQCPSAYVAIGQYACALKATKFGDECEVSKQCRDVDKVATCNYGRCECPYSHILGRCGYQKNAKNGASWHSGYQQDGLETCLPKSRLHERCCTDKQCYEKVPNSECKNDVCICSSDYKSIANLACERQASLGSECYSDYECSAIPGAICKKLQTSSLEGRCTCDETRGFQVQSRREARLLPENNTVLHSGSGRTAKFLDYVGTGDRYCRQSGLHFPLRAYVFYASCCNIQQRWIGQIGIDCNINDCKSGDWSLSVNHQDVSTDSQGSVLYTGLLPQDLNLKMGISKRNEPVTDWAALTIKPDPCCNIRPSLISSTRTAILQPGLFGCAGLSNTCPGTAAQNAFCLFPLSQLSRDACGGYVEVTSSGSINSNDDCVVINGCVAYNAARGLDGSRSPPDSTTCRLTLLLTSCSGKTTVEILTVIITAAQTCQTPPAVCSPPGIKGSPGDSGTKGAVGDDGIKGLAGDKGMQGDKGMMGDKGMQGDKGMMGDKGMQGDKGMGGDKGMAGTDGAPGVKGSPGDNPAPDGSFRVNDLKACPDGMCSPSPPLSCVAQQCQCPDGMCAQCAGPNCVCQTGAQNPASGKCTGGR